MNKEALLLIIAQKGYNIGFGKMKHFITYNIYCKIPRATSLFVILIGILQLLNFYKINISVNTQEIISACLIFLGIVALVLMLLHNDQI